MVSQNRTEKQKNFPIQRCIAGEDLRTFSDVDLLAIVIHAGSREKDVFQLANEIFLHFGGVKGIYQAGLRELAGYSGIGLKKAVRIQAALELGKRIIHQNNNGISLNSPKLVWQYLCPDFIGCENEHFFVLLLNNKNVVLCKKIISIGTVSETIVHPREVFKSAVRESASAVVVAHNHPSNQLKPSQDDLEVTERLVKAGKIVGIPVLDHLILSETGYLSLKGEGFM